VIQLGLNLAKRVFFANFKTGAECLTPRATRDKLSGVTTIDWAHLPVVR